MITNLTPPTHVSEGSQIRGDLFFFAEAEIYGVVDGRVLQQSLESLSIGPMSVVHGEIRSRGPVIVGGQVEGTLECDTQVRILSTARIEGTIVAASITIAPGAIVNATIAQYSQT